jgi:hypothetical protein
LPVVISIGEDDGRGIAPGPSGYAGLRKILDWANFIILHSSGGDEQHYRQVVAAALATRHVLLIETITNQHDAWERLLPEDKPGLIIKARPGEIHPQPPAIVH